MTETTSAGGSGGGARGSHANTGNGLQAKSVLTKIAAVVADRNIPFLVCSIGMIVMLLWAGKFKMTAPGAEGIVPLVTSDAERMQIAELNLIAARRARASTAYKSALVHLAAGEALLSEEHWETHHDLRFPLALHRAECEFLTGEFLAADERLSRLRLRAIGSADLAAGDVRL